MCALCITLLPCAAFADTPLPPLAPIIITEIQPGSTASASEEFIELYNTTALPIDLEAHHWQLQVASTTAVNWDAPLRTIALTGSIGPGQSYIVASTYQVSGQSVQYLGALARVWFSAGITASAGHVRLTYSTNQPQAGGVCSLVNTVVDQVEWSVASAGQPSIPSLDARQVFVAPTGGIPKTASLQRTIDPVTHGYMDTGSDSNDFVTASASSALLNTQVAGATAAPVPAPGLPIDGCDPTQPAAPPDDTTEPPEPPAPPTDTGSDGDGSEPPVNDGLLAPQITELLPNPAAPQTDANDEFVELYNPNNAPFDVGGFALVAGDTTKHYFTFMPGIVLQPLSFTAFSSAVTGLSMTNSGGQVQLQDAAGVVVTASGVYGAAPDGQSWALVDGKWLWTTTPTPSSTNLVTLPKPDVKKSTIAAATKKTTAVKAASVTKPAKPTKAAAKPKKVTAQPKSTQLASANVPNRTPLHIGVLASVGVFALLYGAYEYRSDLANKLHQFRSYRAARRKNREEAARRRSYRIGK